VFDVYRGEQIAAGRTSLAIALTFRVRARIVERLAGELGGELRG
jgi:phenylalanyl-tRNA synthetase beta subunit